MSHLSGASHPTPLTPARPNVSPHLPPPSPKASPTSRALNRMSYFPSGRGRERVRPGAAGGRVGSARLPRPLSAAGRGHPVLGRGQRSLCGHWPASRLLLPGPPRGSPPFAARPPPPRATSAAPRRATHRAGGRGSRDRRGTWELCAGRRGAVRARDAGAPRQPRPPPPEKFAARNGGRGGKGQEGRGVLESPAQAGGPGTREEPTGRGRNRAGGGRGEAGPGNRGRVGVGVPAG